MAEGGSEAGHRAEGPVWETGEHSIYHQRWEDPKLAAPTTVLLQHPSNPYRDILHGDLAVDFESALHAFTYGYLEAAQPKLGLPAHWLEALGPRGEKTPNPYFGWMPILWPLPDGKEEFEEPFGSFKAGDPATDGLFVVLFASDRLGQQFLGSEFGLRIVVRLHKLRSGAMQGSIGGVNASLPFWPYSDWAKEEAGASIETEDERMTILRDLLVERRSGIAAAAGLDGDSLMIRGLRMGPLKEKGDFQVEWRGVGFAGAGSHYGDNEEDEQESVKHALQVPFAFTVIGGRKGGQSLLHRSSLVANAAAGDARVFMRDAATSGPPETLVSRRVTRPNTMLDQFRVDETITGALNGNLAFQRFAKVVPCPRTVRADRVHNPNAPLPINLPGIGPEVRSDRASAVQGFRHARELFERLVAYKLPPNAYFKIAKPRLLIAYRSGISPGPGKSGQTINACVHPLGWPAGMVGPTPLKKRPPLLIHLACANLSRQARGALQKEPLGIGADARWMWHEFGHVLLMATTGELELRFAHSPGDALAAIVADPDSDDEIRSDPRWRFATFPWVFLPRRHDRHVHTGWSWSGAVHADLAQVPSSLHPRRKGYGSEQILSSSLFRLYRCLGGDTVVDNDLSDAGERERKRASHYCVYLVMRALQILGDARIQAANKPEEFVFALMEADRTEGAWSVAYPAGTPAYERTGGCAFKSIRWAFEMQGMYPDQASGGNAPGAPPDVDIYVASRRPVQEATPYGDIYYGPGTYVPVSLHWQTTQADPIPEWQASDNAIRDLGTGNFEVEVGNRGRLPATGVRVQLWWAVWPSGSAPPAWPDPAVWTQATPSSSGPKTIAPGQTESFGPFSPNAAGERLLLLAVADCLDDRSNINPSTSLPCATIRTKVIDLVANDNNLGLHVVW